MKSAITQRKGIPFFYLKSELEFQQDVYERYEDMVVRQSALHLADELWGSYPFQPVFDFAEGHYPEEADINILEVGCGVGRWIGTLAKRYDKARLWGIDYSYQMLKRANEFWVAGKELTVDLRDKGLYHQSVKGEHCNNLNFGLAKAACLPFDVNSQDVVLNSFLIDRLDDPKKALQEIYRVLKPNSKLIAVSPLNYNKADHWELYYPPTKLSDVLEGIGFEILEWQEDIIINEPLDVHGNVVRWKCLGFVARKSENIALILS